MNFIVKENSGRNQVRYAGPARRLGTAVHIICFCCRRARGWDRRWLCCPLRSCDSLQVGRRFSGLAVRGLVSSTRKGHFPGGEQESSSCCLFQWTYSPGSSGRVLSVAGCNLVQRKFLQPEEELTIDDQRFFDGFCWATWGSECGEWGRGSERLFFKGGDLRFRSPSDSTFVTSSLGFHEVISLLSCPEGIPYSLRDSAEFLGGQPVKWALSHCAEMMGLPHTGRMFWS